MPLCAEEGEQDVEHGRRDRLIHSRPGADKRIRIVSVTSKGRRLVESAEPNWHQAQEALLATIGVDRWRTMSTVLRDTTPPGAAVGGDSGLTAPR